jgi:hypothetical protein
MANAIRNAQLNVDDIDPAVAFYSRWFRVRSWRSRGGAWPFRRCCGTNPAENANAAACACFAG